MEIQFMGRKYSTGELIRKRRMLMKELEADEKNVISRKMLILSGSTIGELADQLQMFCLSKGIKLEIVQGDYGRFYEDAIYGKVVSKDEYDFIYVHTSSRNILKWPEPFEDRATTEEKLNFEKGRIFQVVSALTKKYACPIIVNNFEMLPYRTLGNSEVWEKSGTIYFINQLNEYVNVLTTENNSLYINDMNYLSAYFGLKEWANPSYWYRYKYAMCIEAIPLVAQNLSTLVVALCGMNKKCLALDLDNTLWGGVIGDDGVDHIVIGNDSPQGEAYSEFQRYILRLKKGGMILGIISKNNEDVAKTAFGKNEMIIRDEDIASFKINWENKSENLWHMAEELNLGIDSFVLVDDNPMERDEVQKNLDIVTIPDLSKVENYISEMEECRLFEAIAFTEEDKIRTTYYIQNAQRKIEEKNFVDYNEYLASLQMEWEFTDFKEEALERITQLINKTNQFNLTTMRLNLQEVVERAKQPMQYICVQGKMKDKFGDNGLVTVLIGNVVDGICYIELWLMSCRVLRRDGEYKMFDYLLQQCKERNIKKIIGRYIPSAKNKIVSDLYEKLGFILQSVAENKESVWEYRI